MKLLAVLLLIFLAILACSTVSGGEYNQPKEYKECWALEAKYSHAELTMEEAQVVADQITDTERVPRIHAIVFYPQLPEAINNERAMAAWFENTRIIYSRYEKIPFWCLVHEIAHAMSGPDGDHHGEPFMRVERMLFRKHLPPGEYGRNVKLLFTPSKP